MEEQTIVKTGQHGDFDVWSVMPVSVADALESYQSVKLSQDIAFSDSDEDLITRKCKVGEKEYEYVCWGDDDETPYKIQELVGKNMITSQCQNFNILTCYGQGLQFIDRSTKERVDDEVIREFCLHNAIHRLFLEQATDMKYYYFSVLVIVLSKDGTRIVQMRNRDACHCRFTKRNRLGKIETVLYGDFRSTYPKNIEAIELLDEMDPLGDLNRRVKDNKMQGRKYAILCSMPVVGHGYYPIAPYTAIFMDAWYDIYRLISEGKRHMIRNTCAPRIQIEIHRNYWQNLIHEEGLTDADKIKERIKQERKDITDFCTKPENAGKAWVTSYDTTIDSGKEIRMVRVYNLNEGKKEGGDWADDMQEASNALCFAMGVHPNMVGATPGKSQMNNSGSDKRELFTLKQAIEKAFHDVMAVPYHVILHYNGLADKFTVDVPMIQLTTLDENKDAEVVSANSNQPQKQS